MPGDVACGRGDFFLLRRLRLDPNGFLRRRFELGFGFRFCLDQNLLKQLGAWAWFLLHRQFRVTVRVLTMASLANDFHHLVVHQACYSVVQKQAAARAIIIDGIA